MSALGSWYVTEPCVCVLGRQATIEPLLKTLIIMSPVLHCFHNLSYYNTGIKISSV